MIIDIHCHHTFTRLPIVAQERLSFEPGPSPGAQPANGPYPTDFDSCVSPRAMQRWMWRVARWFFGLPRASDELDRCLATLYEQHLHAPGPIERFVLLAFDAVYDHNGRCRPLPAPGDRLGSDIYTSNSYIRGVCRRFPQRFLFGASVHPYRENAVACVEEVFAAGACLLKWIPLHHNIDLADPRTIAVLRKCAELGLPLLVHCGEEFTLTTQCPAHRSIRPLLEVLRILRREEAMPCVIVAHAATAVTPWGDHDSHRALLAALTDEFADAPLYADISALTTWAKLGYLRRLCRRQDLHAKLVFGSDFPVPPGLRPLRRELGRDYARIAAVNSWPQRSVLTCRSLGFNEMVFHRAAEMLPHIDASAAELGPSTFSER